MNRNGTWVNLAGAAGADTMGQSGLDANVNNHFFKIFGTSLVIGAASMLLPDKYATTTTESSAGGNLTTGAVMATALQETVTTIMQRNKNVTPTLTVKQGSEFMFIVAKDMAMIPYSN